MKNSKIFKERYYSAKTVWERVPNPLHPCCYASSLSGNHL